MSSIPYSRFLIGPVPWYSFLIVAGVIAAIVLACREERRVGLPKDTVIDLALRVLPFGIVGARIYYVVFSWDQFRNDFLSVFRIWEGGIAIYGGIIAGLIVLLLFCRKRHLPPLQVCDIIVPGLALAQSAGRWGNWFNIEAYGRLVTNPDLCFFPFALQVPADGYRWHLATFFYESMWDLFIFIFIVAARRKILSRKGDAFFAYLILYAAGRMVIEELRLDSLYAASSVRVSQLLSVLVCFAVLTRYAVILCKNGQPGILFRVFIFPAVLIFSGFTVVYALSAPFFACWSVSAVVLYLSAYALFMLISYMLVFRAATVPGVQDAYNKD